MRTHWDVLAAADFFTVEVWTALGLVRYKGFFVIRLATREVHIAGIIPEPHGLWMKRVARNFSCIFPPKVIKRATNGNQATNEPALPMQKQISLSILIGLVALSSTAHAQTIPGSTASPEASEIVKIREELRLAPKLANSTLDGRGVCPWATQWPPPNGAGNDASGLKVGACAYTSPVGSFGANRYAPHDLGGNMWQWCKDWPDTGRNYRVLQGGSWDNSRFGGLLSSCRCNGATGVRGDGHGLRCVLALGSVRQAS